MPPPAFVPLEELSDADIATLQPTCSSTSSGVSCTHVELDSDVEFDSADPVTDDMESSDKEMEASDSMGSVWTDSKHSSYLNFMEQNFVRDLYEREYCALDVCGQPCQRHPHVEETHDPDSAESHSSVPFGSMEFKVWENGNWTWRVDSKRKMQPWTLLSNPWVKHFRTRASCRSDMSNTTLPKDEQDEPQTLCSHYSNIPNGKSGSRGMEVSSSVGRGGHYNEPEAQHCIQKPFIKGDSRSRKRTAQFESEHTSSMRRQTPCCLDEGSMTIGVFGELCKRSDEVEEHYYYTCAPQCGES